MELVLRGGGRMMLVAREQQVGEGEGRPVSSVLRGGRPRSYAARRRFLVADFCTADCSGSA